jgi:hypothetical protein
MSSALKITAVPVTMAELLTTAVTMMTPPPPQPDDSPAAALAPKPQDQK